LKPNLNAAGGHAQLVSKMDPCLLVGHFICLKDLLQYGKLVGARPLPLFLVEEVVFVVGHVHPVQLQQDHRQQHDLSFIVGFLQEVKVHALLLSC